MKVESIPNRFKGDGRFRVDAERVFPGTVPMRVTIHSARNHMERLAKSRKSHHSRAGGTLWISIEYAIHNGLSYSIFHAPDCGFEFELKD